MNSRERSTIRVTVARCAQAQEAVRNIRWQAYSSQGWITSSDSHFVADARDRQPGVESLLVEVDGSPVGTLRLQRRHASQPLDYVGAYCSWPAELEPLLTDQALTLEFNRFAVHPASHGLQHYKVKLALLRAAMAAAIVERATLLVGEVRTEHMDFYLRFLGMRQLAGPRRLSLECDFYLVAGVAAECEQHLAQRFKALAPSQVQLHQWLREGFILD